MAFFFVMHGSPGAAVPVSLDTLEANLDAAEHLSLRARLIGIAIRIIRLGEGDVVSPAANADFFYEVSDTY